MSLPANINQQSIHKWILLLIAFFLPLAQLVPFFIAFLFINWLIKGEWIKDFKVLISNKTLLLFVSIFIVYLVGLIKADDFSSARFDIQVKLSLFIFPIILFSQKENAKYFKEVQYAFIFGCIASSLICLAYAFYNYMVKNENRFFYEKFSFLLHPGYFSMYLNFSLLLIVNAIKTGKSLFSKKINLILFLFFSLIVVLLSSKSGLITMFLIYLGILVFIMIKKKKYVIGTIGVFLLTGLVLFTIQFVPQVKERITNAEHALLFENVNKETKESSAVRLLVWNASFEIIREHFFFGVGTGNETRKLMEKYQQFGFSGAFQKKLNAHNQFLQTFIAVGIIGFLLLLLNLIVPLVYSVHHKNFLYLFFILFIFFNFLTESMLETQAGVMFYAFFNSFLFLNSAQENKI